jgi:Nickel-dependent hydrogenase
MTRIAIDPVTRIEGHLRIEVEVQDGQVTDAWSSGTMFRGIELILRGRDPRDAWVFAQRICGVCTTVHALASVRAVEDALGITIPDNARLIRNLIAGSLERVQEGCSSGSTPLGVLSGGFSRPGQPSDHEADHRQTHHTFAATCQVLRILTHTARASDPGKGSLHDPSTR